MVRLMNATSARAVSILGTRPEIIKLSPLVPKLDSLYDHRVVQTGQHYDYYMSGLFFKELDFRDPDYFLECKGLDGSSRQIGYMLNELDDVIKKERPNVCIVLGDTNSSLAGALVASKNHIPLIHVEAGLRSFDKTMPEEINRIVIDHISDFLFAPSPLALDNLSKEGVKNQARIFVTGNTIVDACLKYLPQIHSVKTIEKLGIEKNDYIIVTIHREASTEEENLRNIFKALIKLADFNIIFPVHPRTKQKLVELGFWKILLKTNMKIINPLGYLEFLNIMLNARFILTDSGGIQEEAITLKVPCLTLRDNTERWETVNIGANKLIGTKTEQIITEVKNAWNDDEWKEKISGLKNPYGNGESSDKIVSIIKDHFPVNIDNT